MFIRPSIFNNSYPAVVAAESTRHGGVSPAPYHSLNLGKSTEDATENVLQNRLLFCRALGFEPAQMAWSKQVHGDQVRLVTAPGGAEGFDALITNQPDILLGVSVADCTPILVYDAKQKAVAAIHAGWRGTAAQIVLKTLKRMGTEYGSVGSDCYAYVGTCIDECSFETGPEVAEVFAEKFKRFDAVRQKHFIDLKSANQQQLLDWGVPAAQIQVSAFCTVRNKADYFSHRAERGVTGRMLAVIGIKSAQIVR